MAIQIAKEDYGIELVPETQPHPKGLLFIGEKGCTVPPYLRPLCTLHTCDVNSFGFKRNDPKGVWTKKYFALRAKIENIEMLRYLK